MTSTQVTSDRFLANPELLKGTPKATIAEYVESQGILVPKRFSHLEEARASGGKVLVRSEHPQDYAGASGLLKSYLLSESIRSPADAKAEVINNGLWEQYCRVKGLDQEAFKKQVAFSLWQHVQGLSHAVIADSALENTWHIMTCDPKGSLTRWNYSILSGETITPKTEENLRIDDDLCKKLVCEYEKVRSLPVFNLAHCPIMEFVSTASDLYFLQYHRTRDTQPTAFALSRPGEKEEFQADFVRGCTPPEGIIVALTISKAEGLDWHNVKPLKTDRAGFREKPHLQSAETLAPFRRVEIITYNSERRTASAIFNIAAQNEHSMRSKLFKPEITLIMPDYALVSKQEFEQAEVQARKTSTDQTILVHVMSDGRKAYIKRS